MSLGRPRLEMNRRNAPRKLSIVMSMTSSRWIARTTMLVKTQTYIFTNLPNYIYFPLLARIGTAKLTPTYWYGPLGVTRSARSSPIFGSYGRPVDLQHVPHCLTTFFTALLPLVIQ
ncbi:hypothetical protein T07_4725 [Trichinella nelsoni]|uniref:Uncharacterized protein n=1 Tax=Trichinella nelsoni TaxID=6336 RepID=A0A0V0RHP2_9BILA|nr:hypothetical protein T07_4725 [Trichinella nelsoni]